jgi:ribosomal-protein-alanine N-acetyltransferase
VNRITLIDIEEMDVTRLYEYGSNPNVKRFIGWPLLLSMAHASEFKSTLIEKSQKGTHYYQVIVNEESIQIGAIMLFNFDDEANKAEIGYVLDEKFWGKGYGSECIELFLKDPKVISFHKVYAHVVSKNVASGRVLEKCGFNEEGRLIDHYFIENEYYDCLC